MTDISENIIFRLKEKKALEEKKYYDLEMKEILQEIVLSGLKEYNFFENNAFMGGTALRLFYGLKRYSDDLDFNMKNEEKDFGWEKCYEHLKGYTKKLGINIYLEEDIVKEKETNKITIINKDIHNLVHNKDIVPWLFTNKNNRKKIEIKLETSFHANNFDVEKKTLYLPQEFKVDIMNIHSLFAGKLHALMCRKNEGERDWYDLDWYVKKGIEPKWDYLSAKLNELGPYAGKNIKADVVFIKEKLLLRIDNIDYDKIDKKVKLLTREEDRIVFNKENMTEIINKIGKDGFLVKYKKGDDWGGGGGRGVELNTKKDNNIEIMTCLKCDIINNDSIKNKILGIEEIKDRGFENSVNNKEDLRKFKYINPSGKETYVLERKNNLNNGKYECQAWHFSKDFNKYSAEIFIQQYDDWKLKQNINNINRSNNR